MTNNLVMYKYPLPKKTTQIELPVSAFACSVGEQGGEHFIWVLLDPTVAEVFPRTFTSYATGEAIPAGVVYPSFIGTIHRSDTLVFHVFELG